jgi:hypothetical protein
VPRPRWSYDAASYAGIDRALAGVDVVIESDLEPEALGTACEGLAGDGFRVEFVEARGTVVYPPTGLASDTVRAFRARFVARDDRTLAEDDVIALLGRVADRLGWSEAIRLQVLDGQPAYTRAQGQ